ICNPETQNFSSIYGFLLFQRSAPFDVQSTICPTRAGNKLAYYQSSSSIFDAKEIGVVLLFGMF
ncbi:hypothetical protein SFRURICE_009780, partial [Spodoptera frugiperda]